MKNIQETIRAKEIEFITAVEDALQQKEAELRQLQKNIIEALRLVNELLQESAASAAELNQAPKSAAQAAAGAMGMAKPIAVGEQPLKRFP